ncbi:MULTISPECIES: hypothetical protein [Streptomyces]|uniref:Uncharacterized protein n=2 Tax=Streptomyces TaxID=1883 RepID=A0A2U9P5P0_STRAS|nr:hypothetical protein [Streptomyces actuosus]AWT45090.1 hypothetical protein DMT42_24235 [Streptomyces actuosus]MBM4821664.1 hypothetical protein [Streptomyces actuosus]
MGERLSGGGTSGRRAHPDAVFGPRHTEGDAGLEALIAAAVRQDVIDAEAEQRAVAAFCAARDAGAHRARSRRRDDWSPSGRRTRLSVRATLSVLAASLTLGGVAYATIGSGGFPDGTPDDRTGRPHPGTSAPDHAPEQAVTDPSARTTPSGSPSAAPDRPATAEDTEAHCTAYEQVRAQGRALDATAWRRLVSEAGGEDKVEDFCARRAHPSAAAEAPSAGAGASAAPDRPAGNGDPTQAADGDPTQAAGGAGNAEDGSGNAEDGAGKDNGRVPTATPSADVGKNRP